MTGLRSILCLFDGDNAQFGALRVASTLSVRHDAFLHVLHVTEPVDPYLELDEKQHTTAMMAKTVGMHKIAVLAHQISDQIEGCIWRGVLDHDTFHESGVGFEAMVAFIDKVIPRIARTNDLVVCTKTTPVSQTGADAFLSTLTRSGRPVLLIPPHLRKAASGALFDGVIAVAWDRSIQATRAIHNLLPFLGENSVVHLISVAEHNKRVDVRDDMAIVHWLRRHGITPIVHHLKQAGQSVGTLILHTAAQIDASVLVAGAYGQNVVVERLIGGTTIELYRQANLPMMLTH